MKDETDININNKADEGSENRYNLDMDGRNSI